MTVIEEIAAERSRQIETEGWTLEHDDTHNCEEMRFAAACYCLGNTEISRSWGDTLPLGHLASMGFADDAPSTGGVTAKIGLWPWARKWWKPHKTRRNLVKAAALIVAEIERLDRAELRRAAA